MKNNIFRFATRELSQDAFIAWLLNWSNDEQNSDMKKLAKTFLKNIIGKNSRWIKVIEKENCKVDIEVQFYNIDILIMIHDENRDKYLAIIVEDKIITMEHDLQIIRYRNELESNLSKVKKYDNRIGKIDQILTCYYKPYDECGVYEKNVDYVYTRKEIMTLFNENKNIKEIYLKQYIEYIEAIDECAKEYKNESICNYIIEKKKYDIKYFSFFNKLENEYEKYFSKSLKIVKKNI